MAERKNGLAPLPSGLFRPTAAAGADVEPVDDQAEAEEGRGDGPETPDARTPKPRRKRVKEKTKGRKLSLSDAVHLRLQLAALNSKPQRTASEIAESILNSHLPRLKIDKE